jgi:hypothetical protein
VDGPPDHLYSVRPGNKNDGAHVEQKKWARVREEVGYYRYDTAAELARLHEIWALGALFTHYFLPSRSWCSSNATARKSPKTRHGPDTHQRALAHKDVGKPSIITMNAAFRRIKPAALSRQILALTGQFEVLTRAKKAPHTKPPVNTAWNANPWRRFSDEATK